MKKGLFILIVCACAIFIPVYLLSGDSDEKNTGSKIGEQDAASEEEAVSQEVIEEEQQMLEEGNFKALTGKVTMISDDGTNKQFRIMGDAEEFDIFVTPETVIVDNAGNTAQLLEGQLFTAYVNLNKPMVMIYPPRYTPEVIVVETGVMGMFKQGQFDENYVSEALRFQLTIDDTTEIIDLKGQPVAKEAIVGKDLLVFYTRSTRSIPEQAPIHKVIVLTTEQ